MRRFRIEACLLACTLFASPLHGQVRSPEYAQATQAFEALSIENRITLQVLLTAAGYWPAVPNVRFGGRLFEAIGRFQLEQGFRPSGALNPPQLNQLVEIATPMLRLWGFGMFRHPDRGPAIWVPYGLGLRMERVNGGVRWRTADGRVSLIYTYKPNVGVDTAYDAALGAFLRSGATIPFKVAKRDFFAISAQGGDGIDSYMRYHQDGAGVLGFLLTWQRDAVDLHTERVATLISASLWASMTGAPFISPPQPKPPQNAVVARPVEPPPQAPPAPAPRQTEKKDGSSSGTGFFVTNEGHVLTNAHVVDNCLSIRITSDDRSTVHASVLARDPTNDLAVLRTTLKPGRVAALKPSIRLGESIALFGYPLADVLSSSGNFTLGNVTALSGLRDDSRYLQISAPVQPGNSGGPLLDQNGNLVGIVTSKLNALKVMVATNGDIPQNVNFAIKASIAANFLETSRVKFAPGVADSPLPPPDLAEQARATSVFIRCQ